MDVFEKKEPSFQDTVPGQVPVDAPQGGASPKIPSEHRLVFTGTGSEYFKIWAVNLALTIVTLSFYSPWAKVRRLRYFYANTSLADATFDFHGSPMAILRGRIVALVMFVLYSQSPKISMTLYSVVLVLVAVGFPWLYWRSLKFRLSNTSYRGVRFGFAGTVGGCYAVFWLPIVLFLFVSAFPIFMGLDKNPKDFRSWGIFAAGYLLFLVCLPYFYYRLRAYQHRGARFGTGVFDYRGGAGPFYLIVLVAIIVMTAISGTAIMLAYAYFKANGAAFQTPPGASPPPAVIFAISAFVGLFYFAILSMIPFAIAATQNVVWRATLLDIDRFKSELSGWRLALIQVSNVLMMFLTLGIFWPFAMIRSARAKLCAVGFAGDPAAFAAAEQGSVGATGYEFTDMIGFDISL